MRRKRRKQQQYKSSFGRCNDVLFIHQQALENGYLLGYANNLGLDIPQFLQNLSGRVHIDRINADIAGGYQSGVTAVPALFINGTRYIDCWNIEQLITTIVAAIEQGS